MRIGEIIKDVGIPRSKIYYLEQRGYIKPTRTEKGDIDILDFSEKDFLLIKHMWEYMKEGFRVKIAYKKAKEEVEDPQLKLNLGLNQ